MTLAVVNMGLPMLAVVWPAAFVLFIPIALAEAFVAKAILKIRFGRALGMAASANAVSTLLAVPVTWLTLALIQQSIGYRNQGGTLGSKLLDVLSQSAWLIPTRETDDWKVPVAAMILCVPFYFASVGSEALVAQIWFRRDSGVTGIGRWAWRANALTYGAILIFLAIVLSSL